MDIKAVVIAFLLGGIPVVTACGSAPESGVQNEAARGAPAPVGAAVAPGLAKAKLSEATAAAKDWKDDAILIQVGTGGVGPDGRHVAWDYGYYSPTAKTCAVVNIYAAGPAVIESGGPICESAELKEFMDSDEAAKIARANGITAQQMTMMAHEDRRATWTVMDGSGMQPGNVMLDIDAQTGDVLNKRAQQ